MWSFKPMGEVAFLVEAHEPDIALANRQVLTLAHTLESAQLAGVQLVQPTINSVLIRFDLLITTADAVRSRIDELMSQPVQPFDASPRIVEIPVHYGGEDGPDLDGAALALGLTTGDVITQHTAQPYRVLMIGFAPGFPYIGPLPASLTLSRRSTPRSAVPTGSVAIAAGMTGIYPSRLPGGWHLIGRTDVALFDPKREQPSLLQAGNWVRFIAL